MALLDIGCVLNREPLVAGVVINLDDDGICCEDCSIGFNMLVGELAWCDVRIGKIRSGARYPAPASIRSPSRKSTQTPNVRIRPTPGAI